MSLDMCRVGCRVFHVVAPDGVFISGTVAATPELALAHASAALSMHPQLLTEAGYEPVPFEIAAVETWVRFQSA